MPGRRRELALGSPLGRSDRTTWLKAVALVVALASLTINFGLIDLIDGYTGYIDQERNQVLDAGWGLVFGVILPLGLLAQLRRPSDGSRGSSRPSLSPSRLRWRALRERHGGTLPLLPASPVWGRCWFFSIRRERHFSRAARTSTS